MAWERIDGYRVMDFGNPGESRDTLLDFVFNGNKRATAGLLEDYIQDGEEIESVGEIQVVIGSSNEALGKIQITRVEVVNFDEVSDEFALAEAEGDLTGDDFRRSHTEFWESCGVQVSSDTQIVCIYFDLIEKY